MRPRWYRIVPEIGDDFMAGKCCKGERLDEPRCRLGHDHVNFAGLPLQGAHQFRRFVSSDTAGDADRYSHGSIVVRFDCQRSVARSGKAEICQRRPTREMHDGAFPPCDAVCRTDGQPKSGTEGTNARARGSECRLLQRAALRPARPS